MDNGNRFFAGMIMRPAALGVLVLVRRNAGAPDGERPA